MTVILIWAVLASGIAGYFYIHDRRRWRRVDRLLDDILSDRKMNLSSLNEGELSQLASRLSRIQEKLEMEIGRAEEEKEQVKQLISNMSHQLKTPLANVMMYTQLLESETISEAERKEFTAKLKIHSERIDWILNSLFKMVKLEEGVISFEAKGYSIKDTLRGAVSAVYEKAEAKGIEIITEEFEDRKLWQNPKWTCEVFENLLENAIKYSAAGSQICIQAERFEMYTCITITDSGIGIKAEELSKIFHRFYRSNEVQNIEGSGIGLYLSKMILEKEKGYMTVVSEYGKGSCFSVFLRNS